jgi:hypothetical protein
MCDEVRVRLYHEITAARRCGTLPGVNDDSLLDALVEEQLRSVVFVMDYLQLDFGNARFNAYVWPTVTIGEVTRQFAAGKEALFAAAVRYADGAEPLPAVEDLPVVAPAPGELAALVASRLAAQVPKLALARAPAGPDPPPGSGGEAGGELAGILVDLYRQLAAHRVAIKLVDRCAPELPDLAEAWLWSGRGAHLAGMEAYLRRRQAAGCCCCPAHRKSWRAPWSSCACCGRSTSGSTRPRPASPTLTTTLTPPVTTRRWQPPSRRCWSAACCLQPRPGPVPTAPDDEEVCHTQRACRVDRRP